MLSTEPVSTHTLYFAYGSNINKLQMARRCPDAVFQGMATLHNYRYIINQRGVATVIPQPGSQVTGVLWSLTPEDESSMDFYEGVPVYYTRHFLGVVQGDAVHLALVYLAVETRLGLPRPGYQVTIVEKAREQGFDESYIKELEQWL